MNDTQKIYDRLIEVEYYINWRTQNLGFGQWTSESGGEGYDFERISEYSRQDNPKHINWRATAKTGGRTVYKNEYSVEKNISLYLVVDTSDSMNFGTAESKKILAAQVAAIFSYSALRLRDQVGLITWPGDLFIRPNSSADFYQIIVEQLLDGKMAGMRSLEAALELLPARRSMVMVISDFLNIRNLYRTLNDHAGRHSVTAVLIEDRMEIALPPAFFFVNVRDLETGRLKRVALSSHMQKRFMETAAEQRRQVFDIFAALNIFWLRVKADFSAQDFVAFWLEKRFWR